MVEPSGDSGASRTTCREELSIESQDGENKGFDVGEITVPKLPHRGTRVSACLFINYYSTDRTDDRAILTRTFPSSNSSHWSIWMDDRIHGGRRTEGEPWNYLTGPSVRRYDQVILLCQCRRNKPT